MSCISFNYLCKMCVRVLLFVVSLFFSLQSYGQCTTQPPAPLDVYTTDVYATEAYCWATLNWSEVDSAYRYLLRRKKVEESEWTYVGGGEYIYDTQKAIGFLEHNSTYEWSVRAHCNETNNPSSNWSVADTFSTGSFIPAPFDPLFYISVLDTSCSMKTDLIFEFSQGLNQPDMSYTGIFSDGGSFDINSLYFGMNVGYADIMAGGGYIELSYNLIVSEILTDDQAVISMQNVDNWMIDGSFIIENDTEGIKIVQQIPDEDDNNYTTGNESLVVLENIFITPEESCIVQFYSLIESELNDVSNISHDFDFDCTTSIESIELKAFYPNPTQSYIIVDLKEVNSISLTSVTGQLIELENSNYINLSDVSKGIYLIEIQTEQGVLREKLILR